MKKFKQYIQEMALFNTVAKNPTAAPINFNDNQEHISDLKGFKVTKSKWGGDYSLKNHNNESVFQLKGSPVEIGNQFIISHIKRYGPPVDVKAHEFYKHLVQNHGVHLHSDYSLSGGAMKTWNNIHKDPDMKVQAFDMKNRSYTDIPKDQPLENYMKQKNIRFSVKKT